MLYDDVLVLLGEFGRHQKLMVIFTALCSFTSGPSQLSSVFTLNIPKHRCALPGYDNDTYQIQDDYHSYLINQSIPSHSSCMLRNQSIDQNGNLTSREYKCQSWVYDKSEFFSSFVTEFDLVCDRAVYKTNAVMVLFLGLLVGYSTLSTAADMFGRKPLLVVCNIAFVACHYLMIWSPNYIFLMFIRFLLGLSMSGQVLALYIIGLEFVAPNQRIYAGVASFYTWCMGSMIYIGMAYFIRNWRTLQIVVAVYVTPVLFFFLIVPESPRWLLTRGYNSKASKIILKSARINNIEFDKELIEGIKVQDKVTKFKFWRMFTNYRLCIRTLIIYFTWFASSMTYYGILLNMSILSGNIYLNYVISTALEIITYTVVMLSTDKIGRKMMLCISLIVSAISLTSCIFTLLYAPSDFDWLTTVFAIIGKFGATTAFCILWFWTGELFPTELRNTGTGTSSAMARIGSVVAPYIGYMTVSISGAFGRISPFVVFSIICILALTLSTIFLPETSHLTLPETIDDCIQLGHGFGKPRKLKQVEEEIKMLKSETKM
ncbi:hypothetical protein LOTGIDRAFT_230670 [Lottia gigantea]|uniref:Major facilitator superfamily (MFS) profile domain-containing protein n=1 Tax=Lottia gigantea TaxID=225164 RepID=V4B5P8_LOTGI|nr:hypothetical protein LOTGIDRAFT_230670 [Lottia gigantea]ESP01377.1 hypothetical protein LOTGIDRAFT_230670 [Lottia gigantea]